MSHEELREAISNFQRDIMMSDTDKYGNTDDYQGDFLRLIDNYQDEFLMLNINGNTEKEAAYVRYIFEMASEEFL